MKKILFLMLFPLSLAAQNGVHVSMKMISSRGMDGTIEMYADKPGRRLEITLGSSQHPENRRNKSISLIRSTSPDSIVRMNETNKTYAVMPFSRIASMDHQKYTVKVLGEEKVNGRMCKHAQINGTTDTYEVWTSKDIDYEKFGTLLSVDPRWASPSRNQALKDVGIDGFPIKTIQNNEHMGQTTLELLSIEKKNIDKSIFEIPEGYNSIQSQFPAGMQNLTPQQRDSALKQMMQKQKQEKEEEKK